MKKKDEKCGQGKEQLPSCCRMGQIENPTNYSREIEGEHKNEGKKEKQGKGRKEKQQRQGHGMDTNKTTTVCFCKGVNVNMSPAEMSAGRR